MIHIEQLSVEYKDFSLQVSLDIPAGRVTGLVGCNGAGKSTTIKAILGLVQPDDGQVQVFGKNVRELTSADREKMGVALADSGFSSYLTLRAVAKILKNTYHTFEKERFLEQAQEYGLPLDKPIKELSTGMRAKVRVLVAMSHGADLLILDEPTAGLDVIARNEILDSLRAYMAEDENRSILITSHISGDLEQLCDDIYMIHGGRVVLHEDTDVLLGSYGLLKVTEDAYRELDKEYILKTRKASFGYECLTNERQYYAENYPGIVIENCGIDDMIVLMASH